MLNRNLIHFGATQRLVFFIHVNNTIELLHNVSTIYCDYNDDD